MVHGLRGSGHIQCFAMKSWFSCHIPAILEPKAIKIIIRNIFKFQFKHLKILELARISNLQDACIIHLVQQCKELESINLSLCTLITDRAVDVIARQGRCMKRIYLVSCSLTDEGDLYLYTVTVNLNITELSVIA